MLIAYLLIAFYYNDLNETKKEYTVQITRANGEVQLIDLESYVVGVVCAEMPASFELEALKAQAVAARTFVMSRNLIVDDTNASQVYHDQNQRKDKWQGDFEKYEAKIQDAVTKTKGEVLTYNGEYISALFFSSSNGKTENNEDYFYSTAVPYLRCVASLYEEPIVEYKVFTFEEISACLGGTQLDILNYTEGGRVNEISVNGQIYTGRSIREKLGLNSSAFEIIKVDNGYAFTTYGYGHGVGMSQHGANGMAKEGFTYREILAHYYQGVSINQLK